MQNFAEIKIPTEDKQFKNAVQAGCTFQLWCFMFLFYYFII